MMMSSLRRSTGPTLALVLVLNLLVFSACRTLAHADALPTPWPQDSSDLAPDAAAKFGVLANGMRYVIIRNVTPPGQVSLRLRVASGSREESEEQQGLAHFLEHMAFKGSTHAPGDEMIKILQRHGLAFGPDTNAYTNFNQTVYELDLPEGDTDSIDTGLMLMRETASELTLDAKAFESERGVILAEERTSDTPGYRSLMGLFKFVLAGQRFPDRLTIGKVDVIKNASIELMRDYYRSFYRPERTTLIVVGDVDAAALEAKIKARFADWSAAGPVRPEPEIGAVRQRGFEPAVSEIVGMGTSIDMTFAAPIDTAPDTAARRRERILALLGLSVLQERFDSLKAQPDAPFIGASYLWRNAFASARLLDLSADTTPEDWQKGLAALVTEQRRLLQFGVSQDELERNIQKLRAVLEAAAQGYATRRTKDVVALFGDNLDDNEVFTTPADDLKLFDETVAAAKADDVAAALAKAFAGAGPLVLLTTPKAPDGREAAVRAEYEKAIAAPLVAPAKRDKPSWPYTSFGTPGPVVERKEVADLGVTTVRFANGVGLTVKPTTFQKEKVLVTAAIGRGRLDMSPGAGGPLWATSAVIDGGLKDLDIQEVNNAVSGAVVTSKVDMADSSLQLSGVTRPADFKLQLQLLAAFISQPAFRATGIEQARANYVQRLDQTRSRAVGVLRLEARRIVHGGDARWAFSDRSVAEAVSARQVQDFLQPLVAKGAIDVVVVGDITVDEAIARTAETFGALPARTEEKLADAARRVQFPAPSAQLTVLRHTGRADQAAAFIAWPTSDLFADMPHAYAVYLLNEVVLERLRQQIRLTEGAAYTIDGVVEPSADFPGFGYLYDYAEVPPAKVDSFFADVEKITHDIAANGVSSDELERARRPLVEAVKAKLVDNTQWLAMLIGAQRDPRLLEVPRRRLDYYQRLTAADIQTVAAGVLDPAKAYRMAVLPPAAPTGQ